MSRIIFLGILAVAITIVVFVVLAIFRAPIGPPQYVRATVEGSGYGYGIRQGLIATVRLSNGEVAMIRAPYLLSPGSADGQGATQAVWSARIRVRPLKPNYSLKRTAAGRHGVRSQLIAAAAA